MWSSGTSYYFAYQKCQCTYLHDRGMKLDINVACETGIVFSNNAFCMDIVTQVSCVHTLHNFLWYTHNVQTGYSSVPWTEKYLFGCVHDKAVSYSLKTQVQRQGSVICGGQSGTGIVFFSKSFGFTLSLSFHQCSLFIFIHLPFTLSGLDTDTI